jgi:hypothetical protein
MKQRIWVASLVLFLGGWASPLCAQDHLWKRPAPLPPATLAKPEASATPAVTLGKPVPLQPGDLQPESTSGGIVPAAYQAPGAEAMPKWPEEEEAGDAQPSTFAVDRVPSHSGIARTSALATATSSAIAAAVSQRPFYAARADATVVTEPPPAPVVPPPPQWMPAGNHDTWVPPFDVDPLHKSFYASAEYLYWWTKRDHVPVLVTTSDPNAADPNNRFGFLGQPSTRVLFGGGNIGGGGSSGFRLSAGCWLEPDHSEGLEISGFLLGGQGTHFNANSADFPVLARPFFAVNSNTEFSQLVAFPGISTGSISVNNVSQLWGIEGNMRCNLCCSCDRRIDLFGGFRYLDLGESITIVENIQGQATAPGSFANTNALVFDRFATHNSFYGGQIGLDSEWRRGRWFVDVKGKLAIGATDSVVDISGGQTFFNPDGSVRSSVQGGLLALNSNIGRTHKDHFSFVPEIGVNVGYQLNDNIRIFAGYNFLYWTGVLRPGDQIDRNLDVSRIPNFPVLAPSVSTIHPAVPFKTTDFWATGVSVGIEFRY